MDNQQKKDESAALASRRPLISRSLLTVVLAVLLLFIAGAVFARTSVSKGAILGMLPFASVLAIVALGQNLVIQQGGIDLSIPGAFSLYVVIVTHEPAGDNSKLLGAIAMAFGVAVVAGLVNGLLVGRLRLNAIVATLGTNSLLYAMVFQISGGTPRITTERMARIGGGLSFGIPNAVYFAVAVTAITTIAVKLTVGGRRFEAVGANPKAASTAGLGIYRHRVGAYIWAQILYCVGGVLLAGIVTQPTAYQGDFYLIPSVAAVVLGGTSLLGGRGNLVATVLAALFLSQLEQFVLALGVSFAARTLVQAGALAVGVALYTIDWKAIRSRLSGRSTRVATAT
jgi:ribose transport system permease protein